MNSEDEIKEVICGQEQPIEKGDVVMNSEDEIKFEVKKRFKKIGFSSIEHFLEANPKFNVYMSNPIRKQFQRTFSIDASNMSEFSLMNGSVYLINSNDEIVTITDLSFDLNDEKFVVYKVDWLS